MVQRTFGWADSYAPFPARLLTVGLCLSLAESAISQDLVHAWSTPAVTTPATGDFDGDGVRDYAMTTFDDATGDRQVSVYYGPDLATPAHVYGGAGVIPDSPYAEYVAAADLDGDGYDDLILGITGANSETGEVRFYSGRFPTLEILPRVFGGQQGDLFGSNLVVSDIDADGAPEVVVGASAFCGNSGYVQVLDTDGSILWTVVGGGCTYFGAAIDVVGDIDGDGHAEVIVGANEHSIPGTGFARLLSGVDGALIAEFQGDVVRDHFGTAVAGVGDQDGDGVPDFVIGASEHEIGAQGYFDVYSGATLSRIVRMHGAAPGDFFGDVAIGLGDLNQDGALDFAVSATQSQNSGTGQVFIYSGISANLMHVQDAPAGTSSFGGWMLALGEIDGAQHLLIGGAEGVYLYRFESALMQTLEPGCPGPTAASLVIGNGGPPLAGSDLNVEVTEAPEGRPVLMSFGFFDELGGAPLPIDLSVIGMTGCVLHSSLDVVVPLGFASGGSASMLLSLPPQLGLEFRLQAVILDPAANSAGIALSSAANVRS